MTEVTVEDTIEVVAVTVVISLVDTIEVVAVTIVFGAMEVEDMVDTVSQQIQVTSHAVLYVGKFWRFGKFSKWYTIHQIFLSNNTVE